MANIFEMIKSIFVKHNTDEPEYQEDVEHDIVMVMVNGKLMEVTEDDT